MRQSQMHRLVKDMIKVTDDILFEYEEQKYYYINIRINAFVRYLNRYEAEILPEIPEMSLEYADTLKNLLTIYEHKDYVALVDYLQTDMKLFLKNTITALYEKDIYEELADKQYLDTLYGGEYLSEDKQNMLKRTANINIPDTYMLGESEVGLYTLYIQKQKLFYMHSKNDPYKEAMRIAKTAYNSIQYTQEYGLKNIVVFGLGLGYHIQKLAEYKDIEKITVVEPDINIIAIALQYVGLPCFASDKVEIIHDPQLITFNRLMDTQQNLYIYYPSLENFDSVELRNVMQNFFLQITAQKSHLPNLVSNFNRNIKLNDTPLFKIKEQFNGKAIVMVAGGPSLEECFDDLKKLKTQNKELIVIAVGTVFKKLKQENIDVDYVIITDAQNVISYQIKGIDTNTEKLIYLSTTDFNIPIMWQGERYIAFQSGFDYAQKFVEAEYGEASAEEEYYRFVATGGSVATTAIDIAIRYGAKSIITLGLDLGFYNNKYYANGVKGESSDTGEEYYDTYVPANEGGTIPTCKNMNNYRTWIEERIRTRISKEKNIRLINSSKGAVIAGMEYIPLNQLLSDKSFCK